MLASSMRRVGRAVPAAATAIPSRTATPCLAASSHGFFSTPKHQRRNSSSSSKPPVPPNDGSSRGMDASSSSSTAAPSKQVTQSEKKSNKRKVKESQVSAKAKYDPFMNIPSVPSTQHLHPHDVSVASFFSFHRPMSVTTSVPGASTPEAFSSIFTSTKKSSNPSDVIYTLSSTVNNLENAAVSQLPDDVRSVVMQASAEFGEDAAAQGQHGEDLKKSIDEFARSFRPFNPPPPPQPMEFAEGAAMEAVAQPAEESEAYSAVLTIRETVNEAGEKSWDAHTTPFIRIEEPGAGEESQAPGARPAGSFVRRKLQREEMQAISVKRQRKLKMKKHKYKKLMRKTRTLRRKLDKN